MTSESGKARLPNMTPMVDIVMCILIFFMLGTAFTHDLFLTQRTAYGGIGRGPVWQNVTAPVDVSREQERTIVRAFGSQVDLAAPGAREQVAAVLASKRQEVSRDVTLVISAASTVPYQDVISVYDACVRARFEKVAFRPAF